MAHSSDRMESIIIKARRASGRKKRKTRKIRRMRIIFNIFTLPTVPESASENSSMSPTKTRLKSKKFQALRSGLQKKSILKAAMRKTSSIRKIQLQNEDNALMVGFICVLDVVHSVSHPTTKELKRMRNAATASKNGLFTRHINETPWSQVTERRPPKMREVRSLYSRNLSRILFRSLSFVIAADRPRICVFFFTLEIRTSLGLVCMASPFGSISIFMVSW
mmetsp:Transcript_19092/g.42157  ORF Transcript_19092/g.42157 Transcript_19092/m.42157 type:complete len:221 (+) Transcript_19092:892-1554(+)